MSDAPFTALQEALIAALGGDALRAATPDLDGLIDALQPLGASATVEQLRQTLALLVALDTPDTTIVPEPAQDFSVFYQYNGPFAGYRDALFGPIAPSPLSNALWSSLTQSVPTLRSPFGAIIWEAGAIALLTQALSLAVPDLALLLDRTRLEEGVANVTAMLTPGLAPGYIAVLAGGNSPLSVQLQALQAAGQSTAALEELEDALTQGRFTAAVGSAIDQGGDSAQESLWFLFNLWCLLTVLGEPDVDGRIADFTAAGLPVPAEVGPVAWRTSYTQWFAPPWGATDVVALAGGRLGAALPEKELIYSGGERSKPPTVFHVQRAGGYALSFALWSSYNRFSAATGGAQIG